MNYLQICQRVRQEAGIAGAGPTTVLNQTGQLGRIVGYVQQSWEDIQIYRPNWLFMNSSFTFNTVAATRDYLAADEGITDLKLWDVSSFLIYETAIDESNQNILPYEAYGSWRNKYRSQMNVRVDNRPSLFTILPDNQIRFEAQPDKIYTIDGEYKRTTQVFSADANVPTGLPDDFHMIIVWDALKRHAEFESAPELMEKGETNYDSMMHRLGIEQLPDFDIAFPSLVYPHNNGSGSF